jgi:hypothetical protein
VTGTATDPDAPGAVQVDIEIDGVYVGALWTNRDTNSFNGAVTPRRGHQVCARAINRGGGGDVVLGCKSVEILVQPFGQIDEVQVVASGLRVRGWALDPDSTGPVDVGLYIDGRQIRSVSAVSDRPDVAQAFPGFGARHGFDVVLGGSRQHSNVCGRGINVGAGTGFGSLGCGHDGETVSILNLNLKGVENCWPRAIPSGTIPWRDRYDRVGQWMAQTGNIPDIMVLQEVTALKISVGPPWSPVIYEARPYEALFSLIDRIRTRTRENYRIAFQSANEPYFTNDDCDKRSHTWYSAGQAIIYNADRVRNATDMVHPAGSTPVTDAHVSGVHMRNSFPCSDVDVAHNPYVGWCSLLDGRGPHWSVAGVTNGDWKIGGAQAAVFEPIHSPGQYVVVHDFHGEGAQALSDLRNLVQQAWTSWLPFSKLLPPIVAGDFNGDPDDPARSEEPNFRNVASEHIDWIQVGRSTHYQSRFAPTVQWSTAPARVPGDHGTLDCGWLDTLWSDHCALYAQFRPSRFEQSDILLTGGAGWSGLPVAAVNSDGTFTVHNPFVGDFASWAATPNATPLAGDFNGDGRTDIALTGAGGWRSLPLALSNGDGTFTVHNPFVGDFASWAATPNATPLAGDFNGDGRTDIALTGHDGWNTLPIAYPNDNASLFTQTAGGFAGWIGSAKVNVVAADFNRDGRTDVAVTGAAGWAVALLGLSNGDGKLLNGDGEFTVHGPDVGSFAAWAAMTNVTPLTGRTCCASD